MVLIGRGRGKGRETGGDGRKDKMGTGSQRMGRVGMKDEREKGEEDGQRKRKG